MWRLCIAIHEIVNLHLQDQSMQFVLSHSRSFKGKMFCTLDTILGANEAKTECLCSVFVFKNLNSVQYQLEVRMKLLCSLFTARQRKPISTQYTSNKYVIP